MIRAAQNEAGACGARFILITGAVAVPLAQLPPYWPPVALLSATPAQGMASSSRILWAEARAWPRGRNKLASAIAGQPITGPAVLDSGPY